MTVELPMPVQSLGDSVVDASPALPASERAPDALALIEQLVREPGAFAQAPAAGDVAARVRVLLATVAFGAGVFGIVLGAHRGALQALYCAIKLPLVLLATIAICAPAFVGIARATGTQITARTMIALELGACARFALVLAGLGPVVWLVQGWFAYHGVIMVATLVCAIAGVAGGALLFKGLAHAPGRGRLAGAAIVAVFALVGSHTAWMMRPFVVRPRTEHVPFVRAVEGDMLDALFDNTRSAAGIYARERQVIRTRTESTVSVPGESDGRPGCAAEGTCD